MSTDPPLTPDPNEPVNDKTREMLIGRLRKAVIKDLEQRARYSDIMKRWNSDDSKHSVTPEELRKLLGDVYPPREDATPET